MPSLVALPVERQAWLPEAQLAIVPDVAANADLRIFIVETGIESNRIRQLTADPDIGFAALFLDGGFIDREVSADRFAAGQEIEQLDLMVERVERSLDASLDGEATKVRAGPV